MGDDLSDALTGRMPIVSHETAGVDCCGCIVAAVEGSNVELRCNECGAVVGVVQVDILKGLLGLDCGKAATVEDGSEQSDPEWVDIHDDTCTWYEFSDGREPIAVLRCNRCGHHPKVDQDGVACPLCGNRSPVRSTDLEKVVEAWNTMVDPGD